MNKLQNFILKDESFCVIEEDIYMCYLKTLEEFKRLFLQKI